MAKHIDFPQRNLVVRGHPEEGIGDLHTHNCVENGMPLLTSCWELTPEEQAEVMITGKVWVRMVRPPDGIPAILVCGADPLRQYRDKA